MREIIEFLSVKYYLGDFQVLSNYPSGYECVGQSDMEKPLLKCKHDKIYLFDPNTNECLYMAPSLENLRRYFKELADPRGDNEGMRAEWVRNYLEKEDPDLINDEDGFWPVFMEELGYGVL